MIPEDKIQEVKDASDILEVISQHVTLKKRGKTYTGLCPFHSEKTPSFNVDPVRGFYKCFGCGEGGNVFTFLMQMERISFPEAVRTLAARAGISLPESQQDDGKLQETELLYLANKHAADFFQRCLYQTPEGNKALEYFLQRGFSRETAEKFQVGYAPDKWDGLLKSAAGSAVSPGALLKAGLCVPRKSGEGMYDRFRCRLMFPVHNPAGRVVGFGGRMLKKGEKTPKYLNSPETPVYQKSKLLYGLYQSKNMIRDKDLAVLVEGYTDVIRCHQEEAGFAVATSGTALTYEQARLISRYTKRVSLVYDGDSAGFQAALRGADILTAAGLQVSAAPLPGGSDPDTFLRGRGPGEMTELLAKGRSFIDFRLDKLKAQGKFTTAAQRAQAANLLMETVRAIPDPLEKNMAVKELAEKLGVEERLLQQKLVSGQAAPQRTADKEELQPSRKVDKALERAEKLIIQLLISKGSWAGPVFSVLKADIFVSSQVRRLFSDLHADWKQGKPLNLENLLSRHAGDPGTARFISSLMTEPLEAETDLGRLGLDCAVRIKRAVLEEKIGQIREEIRTLQQHKKSHRTQQQAYLKLKRELTQLPDRVAAVWHRSAEEH